MKKSTKAILGVAAATAAGVVAYKNKDKIKGKVAEIKEKKKAKKCSCKEK